MVYDKFEHVRVDIRAHRSIDDELDRNVTGDIALFAMSFTALCTFSAITLGDPQSALRRCVRWCVRWRRCVRWCVRRLCVALSPETPRTPKTEDRLPAKPLKMKLQKRVGSED